MNTEALLLVAAVAGVGVLHTIVPDHWVPITLIARQRAWSKAETARASFQAGVGHVLSTLAIGLVVWIAGVAFAARFGAIVDTVASLALIGFGGWIMVSALRETRRGGGHGHSHSHDHGHGVHGPELQRIETDHATLELSIFEEDVPPRFRLTGADATFARVETVREDGSRQVFAMANHGAYWESLDEIPEPHGFGVAVIIDHGGHAHTHTTEFTEHAHDHGHGHGAHGTYPHDDALYLPLSGATAVLLRHEHAHLHGGGQPHVHMHDHEAATAHEVGAGVDAVPPMHAHKHKTSSRTALLIILGSSPMIEGLPAFFAAGKYGAGLIALMTLVFATSTIGTYVLLCVSSAAVARRVKLGAFERHGEVLSGAFIAVVGMVFWVWPVL